MNEPSLIKIKPTIGRRVWYFPSDWDRGRVEGVTQPETVIQADYSQPCDAGICYVHSDRLVNLTVADHNGRLHQRASVTLLQPGDIPAPNTAYATWMPYQIGQANNAA